MVTMGQWFLKQLMEQSPPFHENPQQQENSFLSTNGKEQNKKEKLNLKSLLVLNLSSIRLGSRSINDVYFMGCNPFKLCTTDVSAQMDVCTKRCSRAIHRSV